MTRVVQGVPCFSFLGPRPKVLTRHLIRTLFKPVRIRSQAVFLGSELLGIPAGEVHLSSEMLGMMSYMEQMTSETEQMMS